MKKWLIIVGIICLLGVGGWFAKDYFQEDYKTVELECATPNSWYVPRMFPDEFGYPDYLIGASETAMAVAWVDEDNNWYIVVMTNQGNSVAMCQESLLLCEFAEYIGPDEYKHTFWKYVDNKPVYATQEEYVGLVMEYSGANEPLPQGESI